VCKNKTKQNKKIAGDPRKLLIHFFGWDDQYNEWIDNNSDRLRLASMFETTRQRLESDAQVVRKVRIFGNILASVAAPPLDLPKEQLVSGNLLGNHKLLSFAIQHNLCN
jgi:hypothetical protein